MGALSSARIIMPLVIDLLSPRKIVDIGCGRGAWLKVCRELGIDDVLGVDGGYVDKSALLIDKSEFLVADLSRPPALKCTADLVLCLEVGEHLPLSAASRLVRLVTAVAPCVLFGAAVPGQCGTNHVNEQWPEFWRRLFASADYLQLDAIRRHVFQDHRVQWWYQQNTYLYASRAVVGQSDRLQAELIRSQNANMHAVSTPVLEQYVSFRGLLRQTVRAGYRALRARLTRMGG